MKISFWKLLFVIIKVFTKKTLLKHQLSFVRRPTGKFELLLYGKKKKNFLVNFLIYFPIFFSENYENISEETSGMKNLSPITLFEPWAADSGAGSCRGWKSLVLSLDSQFILVFEKWLFKVMFFVFFRCQVFKGLT